MVAVVMAVGWQNNVWAHGSTMCGRWQYNVWARTVSPSFSLYKMVVLPAASRPTMRIRRSFWPMPSLSRTWSGDGNVTSHVWAGVAQTVQIRSACTCMRWRRGEDGASCGFASQRTLEKRRPIVVRFLCAPTIATHPHTIYLLVNF